MINLRETLRQEPPRLGGSRETSIFKIIRDFGDSQESSCLHVNYNSQGKVLPHHVYYCSYFFFFILIVFVVLRFHSHYYAEIKHFGRLLCEDSLKVRSTLPYSRKKKKRWVLRNKNLPDAFELLMSFDQRHVTLSPPEGKRFGVRIYSV